jgi:hypothetical protein
LRIKSIESEYIDVVHETNPRAFFVGHIFEPYCSVTVRIGYDYYDAHPLRFRCK